MPHPLGMYFSGSLTLVQGWDVVGLVPGAVGGPHFKGTYMRHYLCN